MKGKNKIKQTRAELGQAQLRLELSKQLFFLVTSSISIKFENLVWSGVPSKMYILSQPSFNLNPNLN